MSRLQLSRESPAHVRPGQLRCPETLTHVRPVTPTHVPRPPLYLDHVILTCSASVSNVFVSNTYSYAYVAFLITTSFSILYSGSCLLRDKIVISDFSITILSKYSSYNLFISLKLWFLTKCIYSHIITTFSILNLEMIFY